MHVALTWDLLVIVFFAVVVAYSFIVGKDESVKIIISTYISLVAVQAIGGIIGMLNGVQSDSWMQTLGLGIDMDIVSTIKLVLFVGMIVSLAIKGGFEMEYAKNLSGMWEPVVTAGLGFVTAGLLLTSLLTYIAARPIADDTLRSAPLLSPLLQDSQLVQIMVDYQYVWFCLPAILLLVVGFLGNTEE